MSETVYKAVLTVSQVAAAVGAFVLSADAVPFGFDAYDVGLAMVWLGTIAGIIATVWRANWIPGITTGIGNE